MILFFAFNQPARAVSHAETEPRGVVNFPGAESAGAAGKRHPRVGHAVWVAFDVRAQHPSRSQIIFQATTQVHLEMRFGALAEAGSRVGVEIQYIREVKQSRPDYSKNGKPARLDYFGAHAEHGLEGSPALDCEQRNGVFLEEINLAFQRQAAIQIPIEAAAESGVIGGAQVRVCEPGGGK